MSRDLHTAARRPDKLGQPGRGVSRPADVRMRPAVPEDREAVEAIVRAAYERWVASIGVRPAPLDADYAALIARGAVFVSGAHKLVGVIVLIPEEEVLLIENVAVRPERQREGIGRALIAFAEDAARRSGRSAVRLYTHSAMPSNLALYGALGYRETGRDPIENGALVHMRKQVDGPPPAT